jgi:hypothetical protein
MGLVTALADHVGWISSNYVERHHIFRHHSISSDNRPSPYATPGKNYSALPYPRSVLDNGHANFGIALGRYGSRYVVKAMILLMENITRPNHHVVASVQTIDSRLIPETRSIA